MSPTNQLIIERVQRAAVRVATFWPPHTSSKEMYEKVGLVPLLDRAYSLTDKNICKATANNPLIRDLIDSYKSSSQARWRSAHQAEIKTDNNPGHNSSQQKTQSITASNWTRFKRRRPRSRNYGIERDTIIP